MKNRSLPRTAMVATIALLLYGCLRVRDSAHSLGNVTTARLLAADSEPGEWMTGGRDYRQSYYSPLRDINKENVTKLGFAWAYDVDFTARFEATPIVVDGVLFTSGNRGVVYALDAKTGVQRWTFTPDVDLDVLRKSCCSGVNRGVAVWRGKVYVGSLDGYLYALDASTGALAWKVDTITDRSRGYSSTGAPYIAGNLVVIGNSGAEYDARGYITAYDTETGAQAWRFFTVPGDPAKGFENHEMEMAAKTWDPNSRWEVGLGGTAWDGMAYDPKLNLLYVGTGNGTPYPRAVRSPAGGDNLFLCSLLAIHADTGRLAWYYQTTPGESWDYTATQKPILADLNINGAKRNVIMQAPKNGFFYVLDRVTGELLSAEPYTKVTWASHIDMKTGRPVETGQGDYSKGPKLLFPGAQGGHNWEPMSYSPVTGLVYIPVIQLPAVYGLLDERFEYQKASTNLGAVYRFPTRGAVGLEADPYLSKSWPNLEILGAGQPDYKPRAFLKAWDPVKQRMVWQVETTGDSEFPGLDSAGVLTTASDLVFQGDNKGYLNVFDAKTGAKLHSIDVGTSLHAAPMTYKVADEQYVAIMAGVISYPGFADYKYGTKGRIVAFKLGGGAVPKRPEIERRDVDQPPHVFFNITPAQIASGQKLFERHCAICHTHPDRAPDLTQMSEQIHQEFVDIVLKGRRVSKGMGNFSAVLSEGDAKAIHAHLLNEAWQRFAMPSHQQVHR